MSKIARIGDVLNGGNVETEDDFVSAMRALWQEVSKIEPPKYIPVSQWVIDTIDNVVAEEKAVRLLEERLRMSRCKLCNDVGYVYLVDEDPNDPGGVIKTRRDCWECEQRESAAETKS